MPEPSRWEQAQEWASRKTALVQKEDFQPGHFSKAVEGKDF